jgi:pyruvate kinase
MGSYPIEAVAMLARIAAAVEPTRHRISVKELYQGSDFLNRLRPAHLIAVSVEASLGYCSPVIVLAPTMSGTAARRMAALRLPVWTVAVSPQAKSCQDLLFSYGVVPILELNYPESWKPYVKNWLQQQNIPAGLVILTEGPSAKNPEANHRMEIIEL